MGPGDKFCLQWNDFERNISEAFKELREEKDFFDVTLACEEEEIQAHKLILAACSPFFRSVLTENLHCMQCWGCGWGNWVLPLHHFACIFCVSEPSSIDSNMIIRCCTWKVSSLVTSSRYSTSCIMERSTLLKRTSPPSWQRRRISRWRVSPSPRPPAAQPRPRQAQPRPQLLLRQNTNAGVMQVND